MLDKIKTPKIRQYTKLLGNRRALGLIAFGVIALMVTWSGVRAIQTNYGLQKQIARLEQENEVKRLKNENLKLKNKYLETNEFLDLAARRQFGLAAAGEKVLVVPKSVALAHTVDLEPGDNTGKEVESKKPGYQKNLEAWLDFFFHRSDEN